MTQPNTDQAASRGESALERDVRRLPNPDRFRYFDANTLVADILATPKNPIPWPGKRKMSMCATLGSGRRPTGRQARKAAFAANARRLRKWLAAYKLERLASGKYYLPPNDQVKRRPVPKRATYACACKSRDPGECHRIRYGIVAGDVSHGAEECDCGCHWSQDDD